MAVAAYVCSCPQRDQPVWRHFGPPSWWLVLSGEAMRKSKIYSGTPSRRIEIYEAEPQPSRRAAAESTSLDALQTRRIGRSWYLMDLSLVKGKTRDLEMRSLASARLASVGCLGRNLPPAIHLRPPPAPPHLNGEGKTITFSYYIVYTVPWIPKPNSQSHTKCIPTKSGFLSCFT